MSTTMDAPTRQLFGKFPRSVGCPEQHIVHGEGEFDVFADTVRGRRNAYSSLSWFPNGSVVCDKVSFDFDSAAKVEAFPSGMRDDEKIELMREDPDVAEEVLGTVCEEAARLATVSVEQGIPTMAVFSGFGLHVHQLYEPEVSPGENMGTTARYWREELDLTTLDHAPIGDEQRIMRVPNMKRVHHDRDQPPFEVHIDCDLWTIPLTGHELAEVTPQWLLSKSTGPRHHIEEKIDERPAMPFYDDYTRDNRAVTARPDRPSVEGELEGEGVDWYVQELLQMPCMYENLLLDPEPPHQIRVNAAVMLFNLGLTPDEVLDVFGAIGWSDWDRQVTAKHLRYIYRKGYSDMNCETLQREGYCTRTDDPESCPTHGWNGGEAEWL